jgi:hypothetical protein
MSCAPTMSPTTARRRKNRGDDGSPIMATSTVAFNIGRLGLGFAGASTCVSCPGAYISEGWFWRNDIDATDRDELYSDQSVASRCRSERASRGDDYELPVRGV